MGLNTVSVNTPLSVSSDRIKKASYYVWFLGASECRGLRGGDVVSAVIGRLLGRERDQEPEKVTLQVSSKGIKICKQQDGRPGTASSESKHLLPAAALTYVQQEAPPDDDLVTAILLIYNPATRCPVHVHAYRCDSPDTATVLRNHLAQLANRPSQQVKLAALESRLSNRGFLSKSRSSDAATGGNVAALYDSLAAELREKLGATSSAPSGAGAPLLLPPRDYHFMRNGEDDSARSSGIGSDDAPQSPELDLRSPLNRQPSSSEDEWPVYETPDHRETGPEDPYTSAGPWKSPSYGHLNGRSSLSRNKSPRKVRAHKSDRDLYKTSIRDSQKESCRESFRRPLRESFKDNLNDSNREIGKPGSRLARRRGVSPGNLSPVRLGYQRRIPPAIKLGGPQYGHRDRSESPTSPRERFQDARDKFLSLEREWRSGIPMRGQMLEETPSRRFKSAHSRRENREELGWPKTDRDTGYGSKDALLRDRKSRDFDKGYGTCDTKDSERWKRDIERSPDVWDSRDSDRSVSPYNENRKHFRSNRVLSPVERNESSRNEYQRAKSMHDLSRQRSIHDNDDSKTDFRRRSLYDTLESPSPHLTKSRSHNQQAQRYHSYGNLGPVRSSSPSSYSSAGESAAGYEMPDALRFPGLDRVNSRHEPSFVPRYSGVFNKRTYDYPVNGGHAPIHISRAQHDDYRRFRYDHNPGQFARHPSIPTSPY